MAEYKIIEGKGTTSLKALAHLTSMLNIFRAKYKKFEVLHISHVETLKWVAVVDIEGLLR